MSEEAVRRRRGALSRFTDTVYWFMVLDLLIVASSLPTIAIWLLLDVRSASVLVYAVSAAPVLPALAAALHAWRAHNEDPDPVPVPRFLHGYRAGIIDSVKVGIPLLLLIGVMGVNLASGVVMVTSALGLLFIALIILTVLLLARAVSIVSQLTFRWIDVMRLSAHSLLTMPLATLRLASLIVATLGLVAMTSDFILLFLASLLTFAFWRSELQVIARLQSQFTVDPVMAK